VTILLWVFRILLLLLVIRFLVQIFTGRRHQAGRRTPRGGVQSRGELVRDPHCGTYVPKATAIVVGRGGEATYFCSNTCREAHAQQQRAEG
jgi:YHS domain-containing protein